MCPGRRPGFILFIVWVEVSFPGGGKSRKQMSSVLMGLAEDLRILLQSMHAHQECSRTLATLRIQLILLSKREVLPESDYPIQYSTAGSPALLIFSRNMLLFICLFWGGVVVLISDKMVLVMSSES